MTNDPKTHRLIQTRDGVAAVPRTQTGVPLREYFRNADLPNDLERAVVYVTENGPVLSKPDPVAWGQEHADQATDYAERLKTQIDDKGYYSRTLGLYAERLADRTGHPKEEMKAVIADAFTREVGKDPFKYLEDVRREKGLPINKRQGPGQEPEQSQG